MPVLIEKKLNKMLFETIFTAGVDREIEWRKIRSATVQTEMDLFFCYECCPDVLLTLG